MAKATGKKAAAKAAPKKAAAKKAAAPNVKKAAAASPKKAAAPQPKKAAAPQPKKVAAPQPKKAAATKVAAKKVAPKKAAPKKAAAKKVAASSPADQKSLLQKLFIDGLKDIYWAEKQLTKSLPKLMRAATSDQLKQAFEEHRVVTEQQVGRVEQVFQLIGVKAIAKKCEAMDGLTREADNIVAETQKGTMSRDAGLILAAQKVEHYEIASYGGLAQLAETLGLQEAKDLLGQTLQEEKDTDERLTQIAISSINLEAEKEEGPVPVQEEERNEENQDNQENQQNQENQDSQESRENQEGNTI
ncbi:ferritin-like domain-containing protein [Segetibacter koreensis]|uniref:YciE/YciF ferroxidase family protein n=1 Tax=Segetibacter koreensis TaxID=398037 RepID=UPI00037750B2|nr:ferritin-like domain-containing protein [Segetibacter koreensis]